MSLEKKIRSALKNSTVKFVGVAGVAGLAIGAAYLIVTVAAIQTHSSLPQLNGPPCVGGPYGISAHNYLSLCRFRGDRAELEVTSGFFFQWYTKISAVDEDGDGLVDSGSKTVRRLFFTSTKKVEGEQNLRGSVYQKQFDYTTGRNPSVAPPR